MERLNELTNNAKFCANSVGVSTTDGGEISKLGISGFSSTNDALLDGAADPRNGAPVVGLASVLINKVQV